MSEIRINIEEQHLFTFLNFLKTLNYIQIREVLTATTSHKEVKTSKQHLVDINRADTTWQTAVKPLRTTVTADELIHEQQYQRTDWQYLKDLAADMDIQEPIEELLGQLTP